MTSHSFIKTMIDARWNYHGNQTDIDYWDKVITELSVHELNQLVTFCLDATGIKLKKDKVPEVVQAINNDENFLISSEIIDVEQHFNRKVIYKIMNCIVISDFQLDSVLMLPPKLRSERLEELSKSMDIEKNLIIQVDKHWRGIAAQ